MMPPESKSDPRKLLCVFAHPDDETLGTGGMLAHYAAQGVEMTLLTATRGQRGWLGPPEKYPGPEALGQTREAELRQAAEALGIQQVLLLDYLDGELAQAEPGSIIAQIAATIRQVRPQVVVTFGPDGIYGHPDHIAISQFASAAVVVAAEANTALPGSLPPHQVLKLYYNVASQERLALYQSAMGELALEVDGEKRHPVGWPHWAITTRIDAQAYWQQVWRAVSCHCSQLPAYEALQDLPEATHRKVWGTQEYYRAFSLVNGGGEVERDLFAGIG